MTVAELIKDLNERAENVDPYGLYGGGMAFAFRSVIEDYLAHLPLIQRIG